MNKQPEAGFSLLEVLAALLILALSIVALSENQTQSIHLTKTAQLRDQALILARSKMNELDRAISEKGLVEIRDQEQGEFDQELYPSYRWVVLKQKIPVPNFASLVSMASGEEASEEEFDTSSMEGPLKMITDIWGKAIRQVSIEVFWKERNNEKSYKLVTHYVEKDAFSQVQGLVGGLGGSSSSNEEQNENQGDVPSEN
ncbi:MAG: prepilin-type N-terminal cleavage/methylation domain-containing protein [Bdellovibrionales bacterium]|nr:prepilin-type N-terminal cleavage/methylation domain-containing protein [Bdellovibrionales bacterium]